MANKVKKTGFVPIDLSEKQQSEIKRAVNLLKQLEKQRWELLTTWPQFFELAQIVNSKSEKCIAFYREEFKDNGPSKRYLVFGFSHTLKFFIGICKSVQKLGSDQFLPPDDYLNCEGDVIQFLERFQLTDPAFPRATQRSNSAKKPYDPNSKYISIVLDLLPQLSEKQIEIFDQLSRDPQVFFEKCMPKEKVHIKDVSLN